jgi:hypothetical protein
MTIRAEVEAPNETNHTLGSLKDRFEDILGEKSVPLPKDRP